MKKLIAIISFILLITCIFTRCAKIVSPEGGPKDTLAPILVRSIPAMNSINFKGKKLVLTFNEYIQLKDIQKKLAISPPMVKKPELVMKGKSLELSFKEPLKENTTYTIYFADAIVDNNEGNALKNLVFAFSTGIFIDSLVVSGRIINSYTLLPEDNVFVMLYDTLTDSVPIKDLPRYLTLSDKNGIFTLHNLQPKDYKVFALRDNNSNYKFDQVSEDIAFLDKPIKKDTLKCPSQLDTSRLAKREINLKMFKENSSIQALTGFSRSQRRKLSIPFTKKPEGEVTLTPLNFKADSSWFLKETNQLQDSLYYWITDDRVNSIDTLKIEVSYLKTDSLQRLTPKLDTLKFVYVEPEIKQKRKNKKDDKNQKEEDKKVYLKVNSSIKNNQIAKPTKPFELSFPMPLKKVNDNLITLTNLKDSSTIGDIKIVKDSSNLRLYRFSYAWEPDTSYKLEILPGAFTSLDGIENDTLKLQFKGANPENFGVLNITLQNIKEATIIELLNEKRTQVYERRVVNTSEKATFTFIDPGKYTLRFFEDSNSNGVWDTGWYLKGIQPEKVINYEEGKDKGVLNIRANWENDITFDLAK